MTDIICKFLRVYFVICRIIAVGYEARACGVNRNMWGDDAKKVCPDIHFFRVPEFRGKADLTKYIYFQFS